jgi:hypothetical protein
MRMIGVAAVAVLWIGLAGTTAATPLTEGYDPARLPYEPRAERLDACTLTMGVDPAWSRERRESRLESGRVLTTHSFETGEEQARPPYWQRHGVPMDRFAFNPRLDVWVFCRPATQTDRADPARAAQRALGIRSRSARRTLAQVQPIRLGGLAGAHLMVVEDRRGARQMLIAGIAGDRSVGIDLRVASDPGLPRGQALPAGTVFEARDRSGSARARLAVPARALPRRQPGEQLYRLRSFEEDLALMRRILGTLR